MLTSAEHGAGLLLTTRFRLWRKGSASHLSLSTTTASTLSTTAVQSLGTVWCGCVVRGPVLSTDRSGPVLSADRSGPVHDEFDVCILEGNGQNVDVLPLIRIIYSPGDS